MTDDPIMAERRRGRDGDLDSSEESIAGTGSGAVPSPASVHQSADNDPDHDAGDASMGQPPASRDRPTFKGSQLDGLEEDAPERA